MKKMRMNVVNPRAAGIDVGSRSHMVAIDQERENVREFGVYTKDIDELVGHLKSNRIGTVAMESTGSYWQTLFDALQRNGFDVILVNGNQIKNVKGKKTDMLDCLWIQRLHSLGLLSGSFLPTHDLQMLRTYYSHRQHIISQMTKYKNKMQKSLRLMNIRLDVALRDIMGHSGRAIVEAMLKGERDPQKLASLANYRVKKSREEIASSLEGNWREDLLFELRECLDLHDLYEAKLRNCDRELESRIISLEKYRGKIAEVPKVKVKRLNKNAPDFDVRGLAMEYFGTDLMQIDGPAHNTVLCMLVQVGNGIYRFPTAKHFVSWLRLAPNNKISGGRILSSRTPKGRNSLAVAFRQAANSIGNQKSGEMHRFFKRIAFRKGRAAAVTATARKLAVIMYNMIVKKENYMPQDEREISDRAKNRMIKQVRKSLSKLNLDENQLKHLFLEHSVSYT